MGRLYRGTSGERRAVDGGSDRERRAVDGGSDREPRALAGEPGPPS
jgi:hypothetical protein